MAGSSKQMTEGAVQRFRRSSKERAGGAVKKFRRSSTEQENGPQLSFVYCSSGKSQKCHILTTRLTLVSLLQKVKKYCS